MHHRRNSLEIACSNVVTEETTALNTRLFLSFHNIQEMRATQESSPWRWIFGIELRAEPEML